MAADPTPQLLVGLLGAALAALQVGVCLPAPAGATAPPAEGSSVADLSAAAPASPDSAAFLHVETLPPGLLVFVDGDPVGRSPLTLSGLRAGRVAHVRVLRDIARRFDRNRDEADVRLSPGDTARTAFDLRPPIALETDPARADVAVRRAGPPGDSLLGTTPLLVPPAELPERLFLFHHPCCADTSLGGTALLALAAREGTARIVLRPLSLPSPAPKSGRPIYRRRWVQWGLLTLGAGLTGASALLKRQGDRWYDRYLDSSDRRVLDDYFDRAVHYDHLSLAALGTGQALFTGGLVLLLSHSSR